MIVKPQKGKHVIVHGDSSLARFKRSFDLIITSPPYFHMVKKSRSRGFSPPTKDLEVYSKYVATVLLQSAEGLKVGKFLCVIKTDAWYRGQLMPIGYSIANECVRQGLPLHAHWIWERMPHYSPYSPSFANIFIFGQPPLRRICHSGIITNAQLKKPSSHWTSFTPEVFETLIEILCEPEGTVLDPFLGTGSVIEAAARSGRWAVGIEISHKQIATARKLLTTRQVIIC